MSAPLLTDKPTIKILLYTDDPNTTEGDGQLSLGTMIAHIKAHEPTFVTLAPEIKCRNKSANEGNKLETEFIEKYHEIWFFGFHQSNRKHDTMGILRGGPESELNDQEVSALKVWMGPDTKKGGVLMTGDHSAEPAPDALPGSSALCPDDSLHTKYLGLGRAIGPCVPRAGRLRRWKGTPTSDPKDSFNTLVVTPGTGVDDSGLQIDSLPQSLILRHFDAKGNPSPDGQAHPVFFYQGNRFIRAFPDHGHEGAIELPGDSEFADKDMWPELLETPPKPAVQPRPQIVAYGVDERHCQLLPLIAAYDGDVVKVGRIIADSTWHHYFNINLTEFGSPATLGTAADQIGQYYANLAIWLAPLILRQQMGYTMIRWLTYHPAMLEEVGNDALIIGRRAYSNLAAVASPTEIHQLLEAMAPSAYREKCEAMYFPERVETLSSLPSKELILGCIVDSYQQKLIERESSGQQMDHGELPDAVDTGFKRAFQEQATLLRQLASGLEDFTDSKRS